MNEPLVSIISSVYNDEKYVLKMLESIINQSYSNWELILIDDASTDATWNIVQNVEDKRIKKLHNEINLGLTKNLNIAIDYSSGKYIVRIDGDDIAFQDRIRAQVEFMEQNEDVVLSGTWMECFGDVHTISRTEIDSDSIKANLIFDAVMYHPTFIFRKSITDKVKYNENLRYAQDYYFEYEASCVGRIANLPKVLMKYRIHPKQITKEKKYEQIRCATETRRRILADIGVELSADEKEAWFNFCLKRFDQIEKEDFCLICKVADKIILKNNEKKIFDEYKLKLVIENRLSEYSNAFISSGIKSGNMNRAEVDILEQTSNKYLASFQLMCQWVKVHQQKKSLFDWFNRRNYKKIAIYGVGFIGECLIDELANTNVRVEYGLDSYRQGTYGEVVIYHPKECCCDVDVVVVTAFSCFDDILETIEGLFKCPIVSIDDIIYSIL